MFVQDFCIYADSIIKNISNSCTSQNYIKDNVQNQTLKLNLYRKIKKLKYLFQKCLEYYLLKITFNIRY